MKTPRRKVKVESRAGAKRKPRARTLIGIKCAYDPIHRADGMRILIDRLWPRGMTKDALHIAAWVKELAPSNELRRW